MLFATPPIKSKLQGQLDELDELRGTLGRELDQPLGWMGALRRSVRASSIESSTSIEGYSVSPDDAISLTGGEGSVGHRGRREPAGGRLLRPGHGPRRRPGPRPGLSLARPRHSRPPFRRLLLPAGQEPGPLAHRPDRRHRRRRLPRVPGPGRRAGSRPDGGGGRVAAGRRPRRPRRRPRRDGAPARHLRPPVPRRQRPRLAHRAVAGAGQRGADLTGVPPRSRSTSARHTPAYYAALRAVQGGSYHPSGTPRSGSRSASTPISPRRGGGLPRSRRRRARWERLEEIVGSHGWPERLVIALEQSLDRRQRPGPLRRRGGRLRRRPQAATFGGCSTPASSSSGARGGAPATTRPSSSSRPPKRLNELGPPGGGPSAGAWERTRELRPGGTTPGPPLLAGARGGFRRAPKPVRRLAALHLQSPLKHVTRN